MSVKLSDLKINKIPETELKGGLQPGQALDFGKTFTDRMFQMKYLGKEQKWTEATIKKFENFSLSPATMVFHYAQEIFEGMKAYYRVDGKIGLFRPRANLMRINQSVGRMSMPEIDIEFTLEALKKLVVLEKNWIPQDPGTSLYIRPTMIGIDPLIRLKASDDYLFYIIMSPVGMYYKNGINPVKIIVEEEYVRAVRGGCGYAKTGCNYAPSLIASKKATEKGYDQILWLDGVERKYIEEVGTMNIFFLYEDELVTSGLNGSILPGITRDSVIQLAKSWGVSVFEGPVAIDEVMADIKEGKIKEVFGTGTAAVISPVGLLSYKGEDVTINDQKTGEFTRKLYNELTGIQYGRKEDPFGWTEKIC